MSTKTSNRDGADARQVDGGHYKSTPPELEHWNVVAALGWDYFIGQATRYIWRLGQKDDPIIELDKAIHFLEKKRELMIEERDRLAEKAAEDRALNVRTTSIKFKKKTRK